MSVLMDRTLLAPLRDALRWLIPLAVPLGLDTLRRCLNPLDRCADRRDRDEDVGRGM